MARAGEITRKPTGRGKPILDHLIKRFGGLGAAVREAQRLEHPVTEAAIRRMLFEDADSVAFATLRALRALGVRPDLLTQ